MTLVKDAQVIEDECGFAPVNAYGLFARTDNLVVCMLGLARFSYAHQGRSFFQSIENRLNRRIFPPTVASTRDRS
jgi:hypothetical protein